MNIIKTVKRVISVLILITLILFIGYLVFTYNRLPH